MNLRDEEEEEEGFDSAMRLLSSHPSSPSYLYGWGYVYGEDYGMTIIRSPSPPPLSPLWTFSDNPIPIETPCARSIENEAIRIEIRRCLKMVVSVNVLCSKCGKKVMKLISSIEGVEMIALDLSKYTVTVIGEADPLKIITKVRKFKISAQIVSIGTAKDYKKDSDKKDTNTIMTKRSLSLEDPVQHLTIPREEASNRFGGQARPQSERDTLSRTMLIETPKKDGGLNNAPMSLLDLTSSIVEETLGTCEADGFSLNTINQKKRTVSSGKSAITGSSNISLEDLQQHCSMTREKAAESLGDGEFSRTSVTTNPSLCHVQPMVPLISLEEHRDVASSTANPTQGSDASENLDSEEEKSMVGCDAINGEDGISEAEGRTSSSKRTSISLEDLQKHCSMTPEKEAESLGVRYLKKTKINPSPSHLNCVHATSRNSIDGEFSQTSATTNPSLCQVQPMVPLISLEEYRDVASSTVKPTQGSDANENLDSEEEKSMVGCDAINGEDGIGEAEGRTSSSKRTSISLEDLQQQCYMTRKEAANNLGVSVSTLKRACREHGISSWLHLKRRKKSGQSPSEPKSMNITKQDNIAAGSSQTDLRAVEPVQEDKFVIVKAKYLDKMIKFQLPCLSEMVKLEEEVAKRLKLEVGSFCIEYMDEANDQILLACSEDLQYCIDTWTSLGKAEIRMIVNLATTS